MERKKKYMGGLEKKKRKPMKKGRMMYGMGGYATAMHVQKPN